MAREAQYWKQVYWPLFALLPLLGATSSPTGAPIIVAISGVRTAQGMVHVDICPEPRFLDDCPFSAEAPAVVGTTMVTIRDVPPGHYAAQAFHDRNGNGKVDRNFLGIPIEGVGFSNDAKIILAPPKFADAAFDHGAAEQHLNFRLHYFLR